MRSVAESARYDYNDDTSSSRWCVAHDGKTAASRGHPSHPMPRSYHHNNSLENPLVTVTVDDTSLTIERSHSVIHGLLTGVEFGTSFGIIILIVYIVVKIFVNTHIKYRK